jgi:hypothetical protein
LIHSQMIDFKQESIRHQVQSGVRHPDGLHTKRQICS